MGEIGTPNTVMNMAMISQGRNLRKGERLGG